MGATPKKQIVQKEIVKVERKFSADKIHKALIEYKDNINFLQLIEEDLKDVYTGLVAQSGIDSTMPKAQGGVSDVVFAEYQRRERILNSKSRVVDVIKLIQLFCKSADYADLRLSEQIVLDSILKGESFSEIAKRTNIGKTTVHDTLRRLSKRIEQFQYK